MDDRHFAVEARQLGLKTRRGWVFEPVTFSAGEGRVTALVGPAWSGRTALLLTLAGRMRPTRGSARVLDHDVARQASRVRKLVALGPVAGVNDLSEALTARQHIAEARLLNGGILSPMQRGAGRSDAELLEFVGLAGAGDARVGGFDNEQRMRLGIALGLVAEKPVLALDDLDHDLELEQQERIVELLRRVAEEGTTVIATCVDARTAALADAQVALPHGELVLDAEGVGVNAFA